MTSTERTAALRQVSQEASWVLTSLRGGPPHVARGDLAQDLIDLRILCTTLVDAKEENGVTNHPLAAPFLQVVVDPRAAGPHTLVALQSIQRLLPTAFATLQVPPTAVAKAVLDCKFEQTDPGADEAVEMAIADVLGLLVRTEVTALHRKDLVEALTTILSTRNTFVHSPALCYHFEKVLLETVHTVFREKASVPIMEFLVNQLLNTPLVGGNALDDSIQEAQIVHDASRVLCLRLVRTALQSVDWTTYEASTESSENERTLVQIIQDDLCLSLLMTGQAIWAYHDESSNISPGFVSMEVLSEICATMGILWTCLPLRQHLVAQFETIFTGFYTRALVLLRKRPQPQDSISFNANLIFDAEVEIILESLVDLFSLHDHQHSIADGDGGALETIFSFYDCHMRRADVAMGLIVELCRCCGGSADVEGDDALTPASSAIYTEEDTSTPSATPAEAGIDGDTLIVVKPGQRPWRHVPAHLKELCAQAIQGAMKCLFRDDKASDQTMMERSKRRRSILSRQVGFEVNFETEDGHFLRDLKCRKRLLRKAARVFNVKASRGIEFLLDAGLVKDPITPASVASFLRDGIVVGLDKKAVGAYLGEAGKAPVAGKSPPTWERDWFHREVLQAYCNLFQFERQSLLDGLRMFLASFRLPGEAQQIDRILQAFADSCGRVCEESCRLNLFSEDPKRASDAAYLLSFSIIMLNTDQHNTNIREDRKMSVDDFVKNNTDYGRDITEEGKEFPREFLVGIYDSIREEEIRTEGEGADGAMTVERWKDVLRRSNEVTSDSDCFHPSRHDVEDLSELVLEQAWKPILSAIGGLWSAGASPYGDGSTAITQNRRSSGGSNGRSFPQNAAHGAMMGIQGARLAMDMSVEMLNGIRQIGRLDIFRKAFISVCYYTGLINDYTENAVERAWALSNSIEKQSAIIVAFKIAVSAGEDLDEECWKHVWAILFELRDLKVLARSSSSNVGSLFHESDSDLLTDEARREWNIRVIKGDMEYDANASKMKNRTSYGSVLGAFGRALFGSDDPKHEEDYSGVDPIGFSRHIDSHGKNELVVWNDSGASDTEADSCTEPVSQSDDLSQTTPGAAFQNLLIRESLNMSQKLNMPVTGLERVDETRQYQLSPRSLVRERLRQSCSFESLVSDSRFMDYAGITILLKSLMAMVAQPSQTAYDHVPDIPKRGDRLERSVSDTSSNMSTLAPLLHNVPVSPASEALAEVILCEIALKNKDRLGELWKDTLQDHYLGRLTSILVSPTGESVSTKIPVDPGLEKRVTGLIRLSVYAVKRADLANEVLSSWKYLLPVNEEQHASSPLRALDKHIGEGLWRIVAQVEELVNLKNDGWEGVIALFDWCATRGSMLKRLSLSLSETGLPEDDVALQCYRSSHLILNTKELDDKVPVSVIGSLETLIWTGEKRRYTQLSVATLDLLCNFVQKKMATVETTDNPENTQFLATFWRKVVEILADTCEKSSDSNVRQHALSMLTNLILDRQVGLVPLSEICGVLTDICVPLAGRCITRLQFGNGAKSSSDELMIEFELCIGLIFKPLRHHVRDVIDSGSSISPIWKSVLLVLEDFLTEKNEPLVEEERQPISKHLKKTMNDLLNEHFQNAITLLAAAGVLLQDPKSSNDISTITREAATRMGINENSLQQWMTAADQTAT
ncbi:hypothetical protein FisN_1Hh705 [Fistulifera solaris]|uniref:SEC7 domain-containing protein n=1 Tax=Fistulifera solaris TaxID=1519565 RepID=A0A1Z5JNB4_FISSO|nr:hypothetical protein FisN_1Hh705 [Fistulifera solaris]|eukprot:GAX15268.1 hypothetical protein FisN_1Hh705 [Fistulifera solaris]